MKKYYDPKKSKKQILLFNALPVAVAAAVLLGIAGEKGFHAVDATAKTSLLNIESKKSTLRSTGGSFHILEVTPQKDNALVMLNSGSASLTPVSGSGKADASKYDTVTGNFGYLIAGQEPIDFDATLSGFGSALSPSSTETASEYRGDDGTLNGSRIRAERTKWADAYLNGLKSAGIASTDKDSAPLYLKSNEYKELLPWDSDVDGETTVELKQTEAAYVNGTIQRKEGGSFTASATSYKVDNGEYLQNISSLNAPYAIKTSDGNTGSDRAGYVYYKLKFEPIELKDLTVGSKTMDTLYKARRLGFPIIFSKEGDDDYSFDPLATGDFDEFFTKDEKKLAAVKKNHNTNDNKTYAVVSGIDSVVMGNDPDFDSKLQGDGYFAVQLDQEVPFVTNTSLLLKDFGGNPEQGHFSCDPDSFIYVGEGAGEYELTNPVEAESDYQYAIYYDKIRYTGGYSNNNWFLKHTLDFDEDDDKTVSSIAKNVYVDCVRPSDVSEKAQASKGQSCDFSEYDLVVVSSGLNVFSNPIRYRSNDSYDNAKSLSELLKQYLDNKGPVFIDSSALSNTDLNNLFSQQESGTYKYMDMDKARNVTSNPNGAVYRSVYVFRGDKTMACAGYKTDFPSDQYMSSGSAFKDVYEEISQENALRQRKNPGTTDLLATDVDEATAIRYIINYSKQRSFGRKSKLRVLDIEPESVTKTSTDDYSFYDVSNGKVTKASSGSSNLLDSNTANQFKKNTILKFLPDYNSESVQVTTVSTRTLAGITDDITEDYDLVYIGDNRGIRKVYRDTDMNSYSDNNKSSFSNSLVYYNIGDTYQIPNNSYVAANGMLDREYDNKSEGDNDTYRFSGNDLTVKKQQELSSFIEQGFPVIVADGLTEDTSYNAFDARIALSVPVYDKDTHTISVKPYFVDKDKKTSQIKNAQGETIDAADILKCTYTWYTIGYEYQAKPVEIGTSDDGKYTVPSNYYGKNIYCVMTSAKVGKSSTDFTGNLAPTSSCISVNDWGSGQTGINTSSASDVLSFPGSSSQSLSDITVDDHTRLYATLKKYQNRANVKSYTQAAADGGSIESSASLSSPEIDMISAPKQYDESATGHNQIGEYDGDNMIQSSKKLDFTFKIVNQTDLNPDETTYTARVFADLNSDGVYDKSSEEITSITAKSGGEDGSAVLASNLKGGISADTAPVCYLSAQLPESLQGAFSWKLIITENIGASSMDQEPCDSYKGVSFLGLNNKKSKIKIRILQLNSDGNKNKTQYYKCYQYDLHGLMSDKNYATDGNQFGKALNSDFIKTNYDLTIKTIFAEDFHTIYEKNNSWMNDYDMLILGFGDSYDGPDKTGLEKVKEFAQTGKAVLFCHDNSSYRYLANYTDNGKKYLGYHSKKAGGDFSNSFYYDVLLRGQSYMDVYGITDKDDNINGTPIGGQKEWGYLTNYRSGILAQGGQLSKEQCKAIESKDYSVAYKPISGGNSTDQTVPEVHGFSDTATGHRLKLTKGVMASETNGNTTNINGYAGGLVTDTVRQMNKGQITSYPYNINTGEFTDSEKNGFLYTGATNANMKVSFTHAQWNQLNTNADNIVVWYTVDNASGSDLYGYNDSTNNYYIYNCGNITYTGAGHADGDKVTEQEAKLFVNTMIAAFRTSVSKPLLRYVSGAAGNDEISQKKIEVETDDEGNSDSTSLADAVNGAKIYFKINDNTISKGKTNGIRFYNADNIKTETKDGKTTYKVKNEWETVYGLNVYDTSGNGYSADNLTSGKVYYFTLPVGSIAYQNLTGGKESADIYLMPYNKVGTSVTNGDPVPLSISLVKSGLFSLG